MYVEKKDSVWAEEAGKHVLFHRQTGGRVQITVWTNFASADQKVESTVTISNWRWDRVVKAMTEEVEASEPQVTGTAEEGGYIGMGGMKQWQYELENCEPATDDVDPVALEQADREFEERLKAEEARLAAERREG